MKLILAIINDDDSRKVIHELNKNGYGVTKLYSSGGFLKQGNTTLIIGVSKRNVNAVIEIVKSNTACHTCPPAYQIPCDPFEPVPAVFSTAADPMYLEIMNNNFPFTGPTTSGKATIFIIDAKQGGKVLQFK